MLASRPKGSELPKGLDAVWDAASGMVRKLAPRRQRFLAMAKKVNRVDVYRDAAAMVKVNLPREPLRASRLMDGVVWDGKDPKKYAGSFKIKVA